MIQGESGLAALNGGAGGEPRYVPMAVCDKICGYVLASAIGMALFHRERTGEGQEVHVPMLETMVAFNLVDHLWHGVLAEPEKGLGYPRMLTPHRRPFPTKDGHICILATTDAQSRHLFEAIDCPELADDERFATLARRTDNIGELYEIVIERMRRRTTAEWRERLDAFDVPNGVVTDLAGSARRSLSRRDRFLRAGRAPDRRQDADDGRTGRVFELSWQFFPSAAAASRRAQLRDTARNRLL